MRLRAWWRQDEDGLEHGFTVHNHIGADLVFEVAPGGATTQLIHDNALRGVADGTVYSYRKLQAWHATGRVLPTSMQALQVGVALHVHVRGAVYPVEVDPELGLHDYRFQPDVDNAMARSSFHAVGQRGAAWKATRAWGCTLCCSTWSAEANCWQRTGPTAYSLRQP